MLVLNGTYATIHDAVKLLGLTESHVRLMIRKGRIEAVKTGRDWLIPTHNGQIEIQSKRK